MKRKEAIQIIEKNLGLNNLFVRKVKLLAKFSQKKDSGYMIGFEKIEGHRFLSKNFPDKHNKEKLIPSEDLAWKIAELFAKSCPKGSISNVYVKKSNFTPVESYKKRKFLHQWGGSEIDYSSIQK